MLDDAFISFRYADNFAKGSGLVFNPGEPVEGYTCFLWVVMLGIGKLIGFDIVILAKTLGYLFSIGTVALLLFFPRKNNGNFHQSLISTLILATCGSFTVWGSSGMETSIFTFLLTLIFFMFENILTQTNDKKLLILSILTSLLALTRPEGFIIFFSLLILLNAYSIITNKHIAVKKSFYYLLPFLFIIMVHLTFRYSYYNDLLPNTFYNKVGSGIDQYLRGLRYTKQFVTAAFLMLIPACIWSIISLIKINRLLLKKYFFYHSILFTLIIYTLYIVYVGGDVMPAFRFFTPLVPLISILTVLGIQKATKISKIKYRTPALIFLVATICAFNLLQWKNNIKFNQHLMEDNVAEYGKETGLWLKEHFDKNTVIATNTAGTIPYYSEFETVDMLGLNDKYIAKKEMPNMGKGFAGHEKTDGAYILSKNPDIIQFGSSLGSKEPVLISDVEISQLEEFTQNYKLNEYELMSERILYLYIRNKTLLPPVSEDQDK